MKICSNTLLQALLEKPIVCWENPILRKIQESDFWFSYSILDFFKKKLKEHARLRKTKETYWTLIKIWIRFDLIRFEFVNRTWFLCFTFEYHNRSISLVCSCFCWFDRVFSWNLFFHKKVYEAFIFISTNICYCDNRITKLRKRCLLSWQKRIPFW